MTRAITHLFRTQWVEAWTLHPLAPVVVLALGAAVVWWVGVRRMGWPPIGRQFLDAGLIGVAVVFFAVWLVRLTTGSLPPVTGLVNL